MIQPRIRKKDTTQGEITYRALNRAEERKIFALQKQYKKDSENLDVLEQIDEVIFQAVSEADRGKLDLLEMWEYNQLREDIQVASTEYVEKN